MKELIVRIKDDFDHDQIADVTVEFTFKGGPFDGLTREIDLTEANVDHFADTLQPWFAVARKVKRTRKHKSAPVANGELVVKPEPKSIQPTSKTQRDAIRKWADDNGLEQARTGFIRADVLDAYYAAHPKEARL
jgi:hypothetical protein